MLDDRVRGIATLEIDDDGGRRVSSHEVTCPGGVLSARSVKRAEAALPSASTDSTESMLPLNWLALLSSLEATALADEDDSASVSGGRRMSGLQNGFSRLSRRGLELLAAQTLGLPLMSVLRGVRNRFFGVRFGDLNRARLKLSHTPPGSKSSSSSTSAALPLLSLSLALSALKKKRCLVVRGGGDVPSLEYSPSL